jgi:SAM-dependent methyltransferase
MKRSYWERIAPLYNEEIFDVLENDKKSLIRTEVKKFAGKKKSVIDIGCAVGKWLPVLSPLFNKVLAVDISAKNLAIAEKFYPHLKNITYIRADMSVPGNHADSYKGPKCDVGICINAILTPSMKGRVNFFHSLNTCIKKTGQLILTLPSLESWMFTHIIQQQYNIDKTLFPKIRNAKEALKKWKNITRGNAEIDGIPHKHYLEEELQLLLGKEGFIVDAIKKIEYDWSTEFVSPPKWLQAPKPWDWMISARKQ